MMLKQSIAALVAFATWGNALYAPVLPRQATDVTVTVTVTDAATRTVSQETTVFVTVFSTILATVTDLVTATITSKDVDTATSTVYETSTANQKRTVGPPAETAAAPAMPVPTVTAADYSYLMNLDLVRRDVKPRGVLQKRATITTTVTLAVDAITTVVKTITSTIVSTTKGETHITSTISSTTYLNAKTTVTITSTIVITSTTITTGPAQTVGSVDPTGNYGNNPQPTGGNKSGESESQGLSTGAKAGIGAAAGGIGLVLIALVGFWLYKRHQARPRVIVDAGAGMSEVPVGPTVGGAAIAARKSPSPSLPSPSVPASTPAPAYYKTSNDGAAELGGVARTPAAELGGESRPQPTEIDSRPVQLGHHSGPVQDLYEMPAQPYR